MISLDLQSRVPIYEQIYNGITRLCITGILMADEKLPSIRSLAIDLGINPNTVQKAYQQLEQDGYVYSIEGRGCFVNPLNKVESEEYLHLLDNLKLAISSARDGGISKSQVMSTVNDLYS